MKDIFVELEAEVDQNDVNRKHDEIERKNLLIANDNLIVDCLSKEVFYIATNFELTVSRVTEMHKAYTIVQTRCLELKAELSKLRDNHLNLQLKYQNLKESFGNDPSPPTRDTPDFDSIFKTNVPVPTSTGVNCCTNPSGSQPRSNTKKNRISPAKGVNKKKVKEHPRTNKSNLRTTSRVDSSSSSKRTVINSNFDSVCQTCNNCLISLNHDVCVVDYLQSVKASPSINNIHNVVRKVKQVREVWKPTGKVLTSVGHQWRPMGRIFTLGEQCPLTRLTKPKVVSAKQTKNQAITYANQQEPNQNWGSNFPNSPSSSVFKCRTVRFWNDHFGAIMGYEDYVIGDSVISMVYYVEGLGYNLFSVGQFCESDLEVAFRKHSFEDMMKSSPIWLLSKAFKNKSWLWHRRLNHLNFGTINDLARKDLVRGLPRLKFEKDHLCSACQLGKSKKHTHKPKTENTNLGVFNTLHMDLCGPMRLQRINGKKYILVNVDDYSRFTWVKFLRSKDETPEVVIKFLKQIQVGLNKTIRYIRTVTPQQWQKLGNAT
ncbi:retrovirus-related pol polyprotein from transposon TNT 1-94 [Tanacetum coccineum]